MILYHMRALILKFIFFGFFGCDIKSALKTNGEIWRKESWRPLGVSEEETDQTLKLLE